MSVDLVRKADAYASLAHLGQWRVAALGPACGEPWVSHPRAVARILRELHPEATLKTPLVQQIALLHTVLWRCNVDTEQFEAVFGAEVAAAVRLLSPWLATRPETQREADTYWPRIARAPRPLRQIVGAAWLDHLEAADRWPDAFDRDALVGDAVARVMPLLEDDPYLQAVLEGAL
jgi:hypothetical protein